MICRQLADLQLITHLYWLKAEGNRGGVRTVVKL